MNDPVLLELFTCLREAGLPLGLAEYHLLLQAVHADFGTRDRDALAQLCRSLWVKSQREEQIFQSYFDQIIPVQPEQTLFKNETEDASSVSEQREQSILEGRKTARIPHFLFLGIVTCVVAIGSTILFKEREVSQFFSGNELSAGNLAFDSVLFLPAFFTAVESQEKVDITITRTDGSYGTVSTTLVIEDDPSNPGTLDSTAQIVQFTDGEVKKVIRISIVNDSKFVSNRDIILRLTHPRGGASLSEWRNVASLTIQDDDLWGDLELIFEAVLITVTTLVLLPVAWRMWKARQVSALEDAAIAPETYTNLPKTVLSPEVIRSMADEVQAAQAIRQSDNQYSELFPLIVNDLPVTHRQMKQGWRYLRQFTREGAPIELDLEATIQQIAQQGVLTNPVMLPPRTNRIELLLLIDQDGSMVPFHHLSQGLVDTAVRGGRFSQVRVYYFHNCPDEYLYCDPYHLEAEPIDECLSSLPKARTVCMIFSDAGAARGGFNSRRRRLTKFFLKQLGQHVRYVAWLNPLPRRRWKTTTAKDIATLVPMFEVNRRELYQAIDTLRGRH